MSTHAELRAALRGKTLPEPRGLNLTAETTQKLAEAIINLQVAKACTQLPLAHRVRQGRFQVVVVRGDEDLDPISVWHELDDHILVLEYLQGEWLLENGFLLVEDGVVVQRIAHHPQTVPGLIDLHHKLKGDL